MPPPALVTIHDIRAAAERIAGAVVRTPTVGARRLSALTGASLALKLENLQLTGSFKVRGALVRLLDLDEAARRRGVVAMSAGNHAQGVAYHAQRLSIPATVVMPHGTPFTKIERTSALGARVLIEGATLSDAAAFADALARRDGLTFIHPYDDPSIIAGQGTVALEMLADMPDLDTLVVPVGGGGLIAGIATAARALKPTARIIGVQAAQYPAMAARLRESRGGATPQATDCGGATLAEGIAVKQPGDITARIVAALVDTIVVVDEAALECAVELLATTEKLVAEGAGAAALAAVLTDPEEFKGQRVGLVISGGNVDPRLLASILMRGLARDGRMARLRVEITDVPGMLAQVTAAIADAGGNIIEIYHHRLLPDVPVTRADVDIVVETRNAAHLQEILARLRAADIAVQHFSSNAKLTN